MRLFFACGHSVTIGDDAHTAPICPICRESRIQSVQSRPPRFSGACSGPYAETKYVDPAVVRLTNAPLALKPQQE